MVGLSVSRKHPTSEDINDLNFKHKTRFVILIICTLCLSIAQSDTLTLNFTIICMSGDGADVSNTSALSNLENMEMTMLDKNGSFVENVEHMEHKIAEGRYNYSPSEKSMLFSLVAVGAMVAVYPVMLLIQVSSLRILPPPRSFSEIRLSLNLLLDGNAVRSDNCTHSMDGLHRILSSSRHEIPSRSRAFHGIHPHRNSDKTVVDAGSERILHCRAHHILPSQSNYGID